MFKDQDKKKIVEINRIVSFLPSATELLYEFGVQDKIYGVTHECHHPKDAELKPRVISSVIDSENLTSKEIDNLTCQMLNQKKDIFVLDEKNLQNANPDLIISQETCEVCAAYTNQVNQAIQILQKRPQIYSMNPHSLEEIISSVEEMGEILQKQQKAKEITESLKERIRRIIYLKYSTRPKVLAIEWIEPFFTAGHWIPGMIEMAGGQNMISKIGEHSRRLDILEIAESDPDIIIIMPCGFGTQRTISEYKILNDNKRWNLLRAVKENNVFVVDANSFFSKPSIRTVTGLEILSKIIHPQTELDIPEDSFLRIK